MGTILFSALGPNLVKLFLTAFIMALFVIKPLVVCFYQQQSGDYFSNKLFYWYTKGEIHESKLRRRQHVMIVANWLNSVLWGLSILLVAIVFLG